MSAARPLSAQIVVAFEAGVAAADAMPPMLLEPPPWRWTDFLGLGGFNRKARARAAASASDRAAESAALKADEFRSELASLVASYLDPKLQAVAVAGADWKQRIWEGIDPAACNDEIRTGVARLAELRSTIDLGRPLPDPD